MVLDYVDHIMCNIITLSLKDEGKRVGIRKKEM